MQRTIKFLLMIKGLILLSYFSLAQVATSEPALPVDTDEIIVRFDVSKGSGNLGGFTGDVYVHTGVLTENSTAPNDWKYVQTNWGQNSPETKLTRISTDLYEISISPTIRDYYGVPEDVKITHLAFVLRSGEPNTENNYYECKEADGKDIFVEVFEPGLQLNINSPLKNSLIELSASLVFEAVSSQEANLSLFLNNIAVKNITGTVLNHVLNFSESGDYWLKVTASSDTLFLADSVFVHILGEQETETMPEGLIPGFNEAGPAVANLVLYAPGKDHVFVLGDFNDWAPSSAYRMKADNNHFWLTIENLEAGKEYAYQYFVNGEFTIADPYTEKILDPWNDKYISESTYPNLKEYPNGMTEGIVSVFQTQKEDYTWSEIDFTLPPQENLVIYELLLRDFIANHDWKTLTDTLNYFSSLGVNAIELMPFNEFEGNESWGYNPSFYFATDKYYGPANDLKAFIDSCHNRGIAVIMDMVLNHSYGQSPLVQLYWDKIQGRPSADNPWYNVTSPNPVYNWGYDFDHTSQVTKDFVDRVNRYWLTEYNIDGFRFDFTKGFTNTPGDGSSYDPQRISILKRMADEIWKIKPGAYVILEHFAPNEEEKTLANYGMMIWGNHNFNYNEATMGWTGDGKSDFSWISYQNRSWVYPNLVGYMESHDEERLMYKNLMWGNEFWEYNIKDLEVALFRIEMAAAFFFTIPGPKMIWQFGEMGYDYSIDYNGRVGNKPIRWDYYNSRTRLRTIFSKLIKLKLNEPAFSTDNFTLDVRNAAKRIELNHEDMDVRIIGNFDVKSLPLYPNFSRAGEWYEYISGETIQVDDVNKVFWLRGGEYRIFTTKKLEAGELPTHTLFFEAEDAFHVYPNPASHRINISSPPGILEKIRISDLSGRFLYETIAGTEVTQIDISGLGTGIYLVNMIDSEGRLFIRKIIKH